MKYTINKPKFESITLTIKSEEELLILWHKLGAKKDSFYHDDGYSYICNHDKECLHMWAIIRDIKNELNIKEK